MATAGLNVSLEGPLFQLYFFYSSLLVLKMLVMSFLTGKQRMKNKAFANPEDGARSNVKPKVDEDVERVRRAHLNDLENITLFFVIAFVYILTNPSIALASILIRVYTAARFVHTFVYTRAVPQPARGLSWGIGYVITIYMAVQTVLYFF